MIRNSVAACSCSSSLKNSNVIFCCFGWESHILILDRPPIFCDSLRGYIWFLENTEERKK